MAGRSTRGTAKHNVLSSQEQAIDNMEIEILDDPGSKRQKRGKAKHTRFDCEQSDDHNSIDIKLVEAGIPTEGMSEAEKKNLVAVINASKEDAHQGLVWQDEEADSKQKLQSRPRVPACNRANTPSDDSDSNSGCTLGVRENSRARPGGLKRKLKGARGVKAGHLSVKGRGKAVKETEENKNEIQILIDEDTSDDVVNNSEHEKAEVGDEISKKQHRKEDVFVSDKVRDVHSEDNDIDCDSKEDTASSDIDLVPIPFGSRVSKVADKSVADIQMEEQESDKADKDVLASSQEEQATSNGGQDRSSDVDQCESRGGKDTLNDSDQETQPASEAGSPCGLNLDDSTLAPEMDESGSQSEEIEEEDNEGPNNPDSQNAQFKTESAHEEMMSPKVCEEIYQSVSESDKDCLKDSPPPSNSQKSVVFDLELPSELCGSQPASQSSVSSKHSEKRQDGKSGVDGELFRHYRAVQKKHVRRWKYYSDLKIDQDDLTACIRRIRLQLDQYRVRLRTTQKQLSVKLCWSDWPVPIKQGQHVPGSLDLKARGHAVMDMDIFNDTSQSSDNGHKERVQRTTRNTTSSQQSNPDERRAYIYDNIDDEEEEEDFPSLRNRNTRSRKMGNTNYENDDDEYLPDLIVEPDDSKTQLNSKQAANYAETQGIFVEDKENVYAFDELNNNPKKTFSRGSRVGISVCRVPELKNGKTLDQITRETRNSKPPQATGDEDFEAQLQEALRRSKEETVGKGSPFQGCEYLENDSDFLNIQRQAHGAKFENPMQRAKLQHYSIPKATNSSVLHKSEEIQTVQKIENENCQQENKECDRLSVSKAARKTSNTRGQNKPKIGPKSKTRGKKNALPILAAETQDIDYAVIIPQKKHNKIERETFKFEDNSEDETVTETQEIDIPSETCDHEELDTDRPVDSEEKIADKEEKAKGLVSMAKGAMSNFIKLFSSRDSDVKMSEGTKRKAGGSAEDEGSQSPVLKKKTRRLINPDTQRLNPACPLVSSEALGTSESFVSKAESKNCNLDLSDKDGGKQVISKGAGRLASMPVSSETMQSDNVSLTSSQSSCGVLYDEKGEMYCTQKCEIQRRMGLEVKQNKHTRFPSDTEEEEDNILCLDDSDEDPLAEVKQPEKNYSRKGNTTCSSISHNSADKQAGTRTIAKVIVRPGGDVRQLFVAKPTQTASQSAQSHRPPTTHSTSHIDLDPDMIQSPQRLPSVSSWVTESVFTQSSCACVGHQSSTPPPFTYVGLKIGTPPSPKQRMSVTCPLCNKDFPSSSIQTHASACTGFASEESEEEEPTVPNLPPDLKGIFEIPPAESSADGTNVCALCSRKMSTEAYKNHVSVCYEFTMKQQAEIETRGFNQVAQQETLTIEPRVTRLRGSPGRSEKPQTENSSENNLSSHRLQKGKALGPSQKAANNSVLSHADIEVSDEDDELIITDVQRRGGVGGSRGQGHAGRGDGRGALSMKKRRQAALDQGYKSDANKENVDKSSDDIDGNSFSESDSYSSSDDDHISLDALIRSGSNALITGPWNKNLQNTRTRNPSGVQSRIHEPDWLKNPSYSPIKTFVPISEQEDSEYFSRQFSYNKARAENKMNKRKRVSGHKRGRRKRRKFQQKKKT